MLYTVAGGAGVEDKTLTMTMLLDFYGELLTERQRACFDMYYNEDLSLAEIAENEGITRQGARDLIHRAQSALLDTEQKTGLLRRYMDRRSVVEKMGVRLEELVRLTDGRASELIREIIEFLPGLEN